VSDEGITYNDGVTSTHALILRNRFGATGAQCGALSPTGNQIDGFMGIDCTMVDNVMLTFLFIS
jgi:2-methylaconitate cis-trans-isomerase PrpF